jgi:hypothetical protein
MPVLATPRGRLLLASLGGASGPPVTPPTYFFSAAGSDAN